MSLKRPLLLAGPTAVGKSSLAQLLAERLKGEIISVDSMQVYRGMDIGTAKVSLAARARVPHHLIDILEVTESFDAAQFVTRAQAVVQDLSRRDGLPIFCGGTGLYFQAYLFGLGSAPPLDPALREQLEQLPLSELLAELEREDPIAWQNIDRNNRRRVLRAVGVIRMTGKPFSAQRTDWGETAGGAITSPSEPVVVVNRPKRDLNERIESRVDAMFREGLVEETERLLQRGLRQNPIAMQALGYRQVVDYLENKQSREETIALVKLRTRQFAKRQLTWFRRRTQGTWIEIESGEPDAHVADRILDAFGSWNPGRAPQTERE